MKTYEETVAFESSRMLRDYFEEEMKGGKGKTSVNMNVAEILAFLYTKNSLETRSDVLRLFERKLKDLKENWDVAVRGQFDFFYYYKEEKVFLLF